MEYSLDLSKIPINAYKEILKKQYLLPGRKILQKDMDPSFQMMHDCQIENLAELKNSLSTLRNLVCFQKSRVCPKVT